MGIEFENCYPSLFADISKQLRVDLADHKTITLVIQDFSENLFAAKKINWFVIISLICFAASVASDLAKNGHSELINTIPKTVVKEGMKANAISWIQARGGWSGIMEYIKNDEIERMKRKNKLSHIVEENCDEETESDNLNYQPYFEVMRGLDVIWQLPLKIRLCMLFIFIVLLFLIK
ncbi:Oidioi.mRNA.OKI2018_I69.chr1.g3762.t1.cds [Oikopleura dioica]|uniref:Oidioi.mRNA.OKI2018_I69.chr1.g3762.t1.cds n=1 Tax=Oikopleura dioica TaxID=34765 RepID=A0ABN7SUX1_OIKDI|nr:Oidioi.mRNA.OKI2018_I69.chr1.g3762.t1.cds [Oikopleura dioica]